MVGGQQQLALITGYTPQGIRPLIDECESYKPKLLVRIGWTSHQRLFVPQLGKSAETQRACVTCGDPVSGIRGAQHCAACMQGERSDRAWKPIALRIAVHGRALGHSDTKIVYSAHVKTGQRIVSYGDEGQGSGSGRGEGIVNFYVAEGIMPESMLKLGAGRGHAIGEGADD